MRDVGVCLAYKKPEYENQLLKRQALEASEKRRYCDYDDVGQNPNSIYTFDTLKINLYSLGYSLLPKVFTM